ncbi:hypothetical protein PCORN_08407 [Listeria cornellensis FSL F6-0969]|uniref:Uncharacterized protein n=1 Tax=Listeria cornellensis FSL F6-0969 TaxID=1265820 RepID=W7CCJ8_9LIST|nr:hypothetical protein PCORN_08407 [Listeria cornellensis FSL F6-0969]
MLHSIIGWRCGARRKNERVDGNLTKKKPLSSPQDRGFTFSAIMHIFFQHHYIMEIDIRKIKSGIKKTGQGQFFMR